MKILLFLAVLSFSFSQTQSEINAYWKAKLDSAESTLRFTIKQIEHIYAKDTTFLQNLNLAQTAWKNHVKAEILLKYPRREIGWYGSSHSMCLMMFKESLIQKRVKFLKHWIDGDEDGNACAGSVLDSSD